MTPIRLVCWTCNAEMACEVSAPPQFGFELVRIAQELGWEAGMDLDRGRVMVFCAKPCLEAAITKAGTWRARPPKIAQSPRA